MEMTITRTDTETIRVLQYLYGGLDLGGAETFIVNLQKELLSFDCIFDYIVFEDKEYYYSSIAKKCGSKIMAIDTTKSCFTIGHLFIRWRNLYKIMKKSHYDVFHCNCDTSYRFIELMLAKKAGIPMRIVHSHSSSIDNSCIKWKIKKLFHIVFRKAMIKYATEYFACSEVASKWMYGENFAKEKVHIIANGIDIARFKYSKERYHNYRSQLGISENDLIICNIGRFYEVKNQKYLLDILKIALLKNENVKLFLLGDGKLKRSLEEYSKSIGVSHRVTFTGNVANTEKYLIMSDVYVMPSLFEGLPVSGVEAQCAGLPVIASDNVSSELNITGECKFLALNQKEEIWWSEIKKSVLSSDKRVCMAKIIDEKGYGINSTARKINRLYGRA